MARKKPIYLLDYKLKWKTFKLLQEKLCTPDGGPTPAHIDRIFWEMLRDKKLYLWFDPQEPGDMAIGLELPKKRPVVVITNPKKGA